jgi:hypothetical protein
MARESKVRATGLICGCWLPVPGDDGREVMCHALPCMHGVGQQQPAPARTTTAVVAAVPASSSRARPQCLALALALAGSACG